MEHGFTLNTTDLSIAKPILLAEILARVKYCLLIIVSDSMNYLLLFRLSNDNITFKTSESSWLSPAQANDCIHRYSSGFKRKLK